MNYNKSLVAGKTVHCKIVGEGKRCDGRSRKMSGERFVAQYFVDGANIAADLVKLGIACAWLTYSGQHYVQLGKCVR